MSAALVTASHTLPADVISFTGRQRDLDLMIKALSREATTKAPAIRVIDGIASVGKTAFAVHTAHFLASQFPDGQLFVRLHGHTAGRGPVEPAAALATLLLANGVAPQQIPMGAEAREGKWRSRTASRRMLLVLDDAVSSEQVRPLLPAATGTLVLVTSRHRLTALPEALPVSLDILTPGEAAEFFTKMAGCPGLTLDGENVCKVAGLCGYLPLAISLIAGQFKHHPQWTSASLVVDLQSAADRLAPLAAENSSVAASFTLSYQNLVHDQRQLFRRLGLHPGSDFSVYAAAALSGFNLAKTRQLLEDLFAYHLIEEPALGRYQFHDLIREHARGLAASDPPTERNAAIGRVLDYYLQTAHIASSYLPRRTPARPPAIIELPSTYSPDLSSREQAIMWMNTERL